MGLMTIIVFIRMIGPEEYGKYSIKLSFLMAISAFSIGWLNQSTLRYYSRYQTAALLSRVFGLGILVSILFGLVVLGIASRYSIFDSLTGSESLIGFIFFAALCAFQFLSNLFRAQLKPNNIIIITIVQSIFGLLIPVVFFKMLGLSHRFLLLGLAISYSIPPIIYFLGNIQHIKKIFNRGNGEYKYKPVLISLFKYGLPLSLWFALSMMLPFFDRFFIEYFFCTFLIFLQTSWHLHMKANF